MPGALEFEQVEFDHPLVRSVLVGNDRASEGDRPFSRRDPARALQGARAAFRPRRGRPVLLVLHDRLDDVELPGLRLRRGIVARALRRRPGVSRPADVVAARGGDGDHLVRNERPVLMACRKAGVSPGRALDLRGCARSGRRARLFRRRVALGLRRRRARR